MFFTNWKKKYLDLCQQRNREILQQSLEIDALRKQFDIDLTTLGETTSYLNEKIDSLNKDLHNLEEVNTHLSVEIDRKAGILEAKQVENNSLHYTITELRTKFSDLQSLYDVDTFNLQVRVAELEDKLAAALVVPPPAPAPAEPSVAEQVKESVQAMGVSLFAKLKQELSNVHTDQQDTGRKVSTRIQPTLQAQHRGSVTVPITTDNPLGVFQAPTPDAQASEYIPSPDFLASTDEGLIYDNGAMLATGVGAQGNVSGPIKLPSEIIAEQQRFAVP